MGGIVGVVVCALAAGAFYGTGHPAVFWVCVALAVVSFWSWGVMHNYAMQPPQSRVGRGSARTCLQKADRATR